METNFTETTPTLQEKISTIFNELKNNIIKNYYLIEYKVDIKEVIEEIDNLIMILPEQIQKSCVDKIDVIWYIEHKIDQLNMWTIGEWSNMENKEFFYMRKYTLCEKEDILSNTRNIKGILEKDMKESILYTLKSFRELSN